MGHRREGNGPSRGRARAERPASAACPAGWRAHAVTCSESAGLQKLDRVRGKARARSSPEHAHVPWGPRAAPASGLHVPWASAGPPPSWRKRERRWRLGAGHAGCPAPRARPLGPRRGFRLPGSRVWPAAPPAGRVRRNRGLLRPGAWDRGGGGQEPVPQRGLRALSAEPRAPRARSASRPTPPRARMHFHSLPRTRTACPGTGPESSRPAIPMPIALRVSEGKEVNWNQVR